MNAYELADIVDKWAYRESAEYLTDAATMLRQQQVEIEALKAEATNTVMAEHCTCYKLGYSQLNDYTKVKAK